MTDASPEKGATFTDMLSEIAGTLEECSHDAAYLENALGDWLKAGAQVETFPVVELQRLDLLQQVQHDLVSILSSPELIAGFHDPHVPVDVEAIVETPKLEQIKERLRRLTREEPSAPHVDHNRTSGHGVVDLF
ncbi:hypothetical protein E4Z66_02560 [Aliishimia ponticola]|uniref:Uncharacterized protein n=1 Tax=Aliishimia ponticola TaxID=2499833 RepID=A0A4S4NFT5_9RHOB|nr:hypothetical protein [Aliishimia ponticola]THH38472.1 hypothetical protein E4Z66_02560 [Aliishimia ponticola]